MTKKKERGVRAYVLARGPGVPISDALKAAGAAQAKAGFTWLGVMSRDEADAVGVAMPSLHTEDEKPTPLKRAG